ncbi:MAG TPA: translation initiation factor IF-3 [Candidatus Paceibacterota bacterium]|nr:translation initiation factor IF-3 [Candidatus Paceibacterota bacterium]
MATREHRVNQQIRIPEVQVIDQDGKQLGVMKTFDALRLARERDLDLVEVGAHAQPPITKIMDYGKYMYQKSKEAKSRPKLKERKTKAVRVGFKTGEHDQAFIAKKAEEFLNEGHWVRVELTLRGREKAVAERGLEQLKKFLARLTVPYTAQGTPQRGPYGWIIIIQPEKKSIVKPADSNAEPA